MTDEKAFSDIRVLGPYAFRGRWRCVIRNGSQKSFLSPEKTPARALAVAERLVAALCASVPMTVGSAIDRYQTHLREKGNKAASYEGTPLRLRRFFGRMLQSPLTSLSERRCQALYDDLRTECSPRTARPLAVDTHRAYLADARSFGRWVVKAKLLRDNPLAQIEGMGRRRRGKPQLRHDEAKAWLRKAQELADGEQPGAVAALTASWHMQQAMAELVEVKTTLGTFPLRMKIGLNAGSFFAGRLGTPDDRQFMVAGDNVNATARAESNSVAGQILVTPIVYAALNGPASP